MRRYLFPPFEPFFFILFLLLLPFLLIIFIFGIPLAFAKLGIPIFYAFLFFLLAIIGSTINIPIKKIHTPLSFIEETSIYFWGIRYYIPINRFQDTIIAINLGGAVIPIMLSIYQIIRVLFIYHNSLILIEMLIGVTFISLICYYIAKPVEGVGIVMPAFIPPLFSAIIAIILNPSYAPSIAYVSGTLGTLIGADIMNLLNIKDLNAPIISIGGAGTFDGIFLTGIIAVLLL